MKFQNSIYQEEEILRLVKSGNEEAFEQLYQKYASRISIKLLQILKSEELVQDILQDVFIKIWEIREQINPLLPFHSFLYRIATNMSYNVYQRAIKEQLIIQKIFHMADYNPVDAHMNNKDIAELIEKALATLTVRQREVFTLHKIDGLSYKEIAERLQISASAINHHIQESNKRLRAYLQTHYPLFVLALLMMDDFLVI